MNFLLTAIVAVLVFGTVVLVHEAGHFFAARHCGIHVEEFSIGFGPALWSTVRGGTRYSVRLLPLGGYNNLAGETPEESEDPDEQERAEPAKKQDAAAASVHTYDPHAPLFPLTVEGKSFVEASPWQRFFVIAAGALMNFVLGFILLLVLVASGSAVTICAQKYGVPMLFAKKAKSDNIESGLYQSEVFSYTYKKRVTLLVSQEWLNADDHVLIIDDLDDVAGQDSALAADALLKKLHGITPPEKIISDEIFRLKW